jgi:hypothetical protein
MRGEDVDDTVSRSAIKDHAPLANAQSPETFGTTEALDVAFRE